MLRSFCIIQNVFEKTGVFSLININRYGIRCDLSPYNSNSVIHVGILGRDKLR